MMDIYYLLIKFMSTVSWSLVDMIVISCNFMYITIIITSLSPRLIWSNSNKRIIDRDHTQLIQNH